MISTLLEDEEAREAMVQHLAASGLSIDATQHLFTTFIRSWTPPDDLRSCIVLNQERNEQVLFFGWSSKLSRQHVDFIQTHCKNASAGFIELGAGSGWLAYLLRDRGCKIEAYDSKKGSTFVQYWTRLPWFDLVQSGSIDRLSLSNQQKQQQQQQQQQQNIQGSEHEQKNVDLRTLLLCWPELDSSFAADALKAFRGSRLVYIGEGRGGATARKDFFDLLAKEWTVAAQMGLKESSSDRGDTMVTSSGTTKGSPSSSAEGNDGSGTSEEKEGTVRRRHHNSEEEILDDGVWVYERK